jgi:hypothetical protein
LYPTAFIFVLSNLIAKSPLANCRPGAVLASTVNLGI